MKRISILPLVYILITAFTAFDSKTWQNDDMHSQLGFTVIHLGINEVSGTFDDIDVTVRSMKPDFSDASFELTANTASINTRVEQRNKHLKSEDFLDVEKYPTLNFKSTAITRAGKNRFKLKGNLNIHGITKTVIMELVYKGIVENPMTKKQTAAFQLCGIIRRTDFGVGEKFPFAIISDEVSIKADGEFTINEQK